MTRVKVGAGAVVDVGIVEPPICTMARVSLVYPGRTVA
jgi:hypothetical protein